MKKSVLFVVLALACMAGCGRESAETVYPLKLAEAVTDLSESVADVQLILLEEVPEGMLTYPTKMMLLSDGSMVFKDSGAKILRFGPDGRFAGRIGAKGRGPGEYNKVQDLCVEPGTDNVCVLDMGHILRYGKDGSFIDKTDTPQHNYDEFCSDGKGGFWLVAAAPDTDTYDFTEPFDVLTHLPAGTSEPSETKVRRQDYIMPVSLVSQTADGGSWLRPLEGENVLYRIGTEVSPAVRFDFGEQGVPLHYMINNGMPDFGRYIPSPYYKNFLYLHDTENAMYFAVAGPQAVYHHFVFDGAFTKGITWTDLDDSDTPTLVMASDKEAFYVVLFTPEVFLSMDPEQLSPLNRVVAAKVEESGAELNGNPLVAKITMKF